MLLAMLVSDSEHTVSFPLYFLILLEKVMDDGRVTVSHNTI